MPTSTIVVRKHIKSRLLFAQKLIEIGVPENKIKQTLAFLHWVLSALKFNQSNGKVFIDKGNEMFGISSKLIRKYLHNEYAQIMETLLINGYLVSRSHCKYSIGKSIPYGPTDKLKDEFGQHQEEYLSKIMNSIEGLKLAKKSKDRYLKDLEKIKTKDSCVKNELKNQPLIDFYTNWPLVQDILSKLTANKAVVNRGILIKMIEDKIDKKLKRSEKTGRIYTNFNCLSNIIRRHAVVDGKKFCADIDLRACHLSFLADYLYRLKPSPQLLEARDLWRDIFSRENPDPRSFLAKQADIDIENDPLGEKKIKKLMNSWINGGKFKIFDNYMKSHWWPIYRIWDLLNKKTVGNEISRTLESEIFRADWVTNLQKECNVVALTTHDGFCLYGNQDDASRYVNEFLEKSRQVAGWKIYFKADKSISFNPRAEIESFNLKIHESTEKKEAKKVERLTKERDAYESLLRLKNLI
jgi:hypothetical protein